VLVFCLRCLSDNVGWKRTQPLVKLSFWGLNLGLGLMMAIDLFPAGVLQLADSLANGYWHARRLTFLMTGRFTCWNGCASARTDLHRGWRDSAVLMTVLRVLGRRPAGGPAATSL